MLFAPPNRLRFGECAREYPPNGASCAIGPRGIVRCTSPEAWRAQHSPSAFVLDLQAETAPQKIGILRIVADAIEAVVDERRLLVKDIEGSQGERRITLHDLA